jgi:putative membrane protein
VNPPAPDRRPDGRPPAGDGYAGAAHGEADHGEADHSEADHGGTAQGGALSEGDAPDGAVSEGEVPDAVARGEAADAADQGRAPDAADQGRAPDGGAPGREALDAAAPPAVAGVPRRVSARTLLVGPIRELAGYLVVAVSVFAVSGASAGVLIAMVMAALGALVHVIRWATFTYRVQGDRIELRRELVGRSVKTIPLDRIRGVDITASFIHRLFGLAIVRIDAAAGGLGTEEGRLDAVRHDEAERLRTVLLARAGTATARVSGATGATGSAAPAGAPAAPTGEAAGAAYATTRESGDTAGDADTADEIYVQARRRWYMYGPLSGAFLLTPFAVAGSVIGFVYNLGDDLGLVTERGLTSAAGWLAHSPGVIIGMLAALVVLSPVVAVFAFAIFNWDFTLRRRDGSIVTERGMFTRRSVSLERRRILGVELRDNPLERRAGVARLSALVTGLGDVATRGQLLPTSPLSAAWAAAARVLARPGAASGPGPHPAGSVEVPLVAHPPAARQRRLFRAVVPWLLGAAVAALLGQPYSAYVLLALAMLGVPLGLDRYRQLGHGDDGVHLSVRSGSLSRRRVVIDRGAVVGWQIRQSLFQRRLGLATLVVGVGAGEGGYHAIDMAESGTAAYMHQVTPAWVAPFLATGESTADPAVPGEPAGPAARRGKAAPG